MFGDFLLHSRTYVPIVPQLMLYLSTKDARCFEQLKEFAKPVAQSGEIAKVVAEVIADVAQRGDEALLYYTAKFDHVKLLQKQLRVPESAIDAAYTALPEEKLSAMKAAAESIRHFHARTLRKNWKTKNPQGAVVGEMFYPIQRVGLYIPGGQVPLSSTVLMTAIPAQLAGVPELVICTPPQSDGSVAPEILAAAKLCGVTEIYRVGGVQAVAAMAHGTQTIAPVDKIAGPGNAFVIEAKRQLFGKVGIDLLPGPSEVMVIADSSANPEWVAADIITQAEHGSGKEKVYLVGLDSRILKATEIAINSLLMRYRKGERLREIMATGFCTIEADSVEAAVKVANFIAPEHLEIQTRKKALKTLSQEITTAGAMLLGHYSPAALGDFIAGPSHTLPTSRTGRFLSGLQVCDFMRRTSLVQYDRESLSKAAWVVEAFSKMEQLEVHGHSVAVRFEDEEKA